MRTPRSRGLTSCSPGDFCCLCAYVDQVRKGQSQAASVATRPAWSAATGPAIRCSVWSASTAFGADDHQAPSPPPTCSAETGAP